MSIATVETPPTPELQLILKVVSRCNLNCSYCYVYNKGDTSWRQQPVHMPAAVFEAALRRIRDHCQRSGQDAVRITFHGGEPCLAGVERFAAWCEGIRDTFAETCRVDISVQTNGTLLDERWAEVFQHYHVSVGLSLDGPQAMNDAARVDRSGHGSYARAVRGLAVLRAHGISFQVLCVIQLGADGLRIHRHLLDLGVQRINYLLPDFTHDTIAAVRAQHGATPCADYLLPILEDWWAQGTLDVRIGLFWNMARVILGGNTQIDVVGNGRYQYVFVETNGAIEGLDVLKICGAGLSTTGLNVLRNDFVAITQASQLHRQVIFDGLSLPTACAQCPERSTCAGGYLPHRYSRARGFDNRTVWCQDMLLLFGRMRELLGVTAEETTQRRLHLQEVALYGS